MKRIILFIVSLIFIVPNALAQVKFDQFVNRISDNLNQPVITTIQETETRGNPYLGNIWMTGTIIKNNQRTEDLSIRYNLADDAFEVFKNDQLYIIESTYITGVDVEMPSKMKFRNGFPLSAKENVTASTMFNVLYDGEIKILRRDYASLIKSVATYGTATKQNVYDKDTKYYALQENIYTRIKINQKDILRLFDKKIHKQIKSYAKKNNLSFQDEKDISVIITFAKAL